MSTNKKGLCQSCGGSPSLEIREKIVHIKWKCGFICGEEIQQYYNQIEDLQSNKSIDREDIKEIQNKLLEAKIIFSSILLMKQINQLTNWQKQIETIQNAFQQAYTRNNLILNLLNTIIANYDGSEVMHENIIKNSDINIHPHNESTDICEYLNNYKILKVKSTNFSI